MQVFQLNFLVYLESNLFSVFSDDLENWNTVPEIIDGIELFFYLQFPSFLLICFLKLFDAYSVASVNI